MENSSSDNVLPPGSSLLGDLMDETLVPFSARNKWFQHWPDNAKRELLAVCEAIVSKDKRLPAELKPTDILARAKKRFNLPPEAIPTASAFRGWLHRYALHKNKSGTD